MADQDDIDDFLYGSAKPVYDDLQDKKVTTTTTTLDGSSGASKEIEDANGLLSFFFSQKFYSCSEQTLNKSPGHVQHR